MSDGWMSLAADEDKVLYSNKWLSLRETRGGYVYSHEERGNGAGVGVLAYTTDPLRIVGRWEECPPHRDGLALCAITGQMDEAQEQPVQTAARELLEEAGIDVAEEEFTSLGVVKSGKQTDTEIHLFAVDIGDRDIGKPSGDGTRGEANAHCEWIDFQDAIHSKDPLLATMTARILWSATLQRKVARAGDHR